MTSIGPADGTAFRLWRGWRTRGLRTLVLGVGLVLAPSIAMAVNGFTTGNVNMRTGPGTNFDKITTLPAGIGVEVLGCTGNGWCQVSAGGPPGWISGSYLERMSGPRPVYEGPPIVVAPPVVVEPPYYEPDYYEPGYPPPRYYRPGYRPPPPPPYYDEPGYRPPPPGYGGGGQPGYRPPPPGYGNQPGYRPPPPQGNQPGYRPPPPGNQPGNRPPPGNPPQQGNPPPYKPPQQQPQPPQQPQQPGLIKPGVHKVQPGKGQMFPCQPDALVQCQQ